MPLWAVHLSDGVLLPSWQLAGFALAALLCLVGAWRMPEEDIPPTALLGAVFFVASSIHVRLGPSSVHLLLNGLLGVTLGRRAPLAIAMGLFLQAALLGHGGFGTLGLNLCVMALPALLAAGLFRLLYGRRALAAAPGFALGLLLGALSVLLTLVLYAVVIDRAGLEEWRTLAVLLFVAHLPIVVVEGIILGFTVGLLARVKPELLGLGEPILAGESA